MTPSSLLRRAVSAFCVLAMVLFLAGSAQPDESGYKPRPGQAGKDVIWLPTEQAVVGKMLDLAGVTSRDYLIDLGSGDGRTVIAAAKRGANALGVEYNPELVSLAQRNASREGVADRAKLVQADLFNVDLSRATVITMFLLPDINMRLRPIILSLRPGTRIVTNSFDMGDWRPDAYADADDDCPLYCTAYLWVVPARVEGAWKLPEGELMLGQDYQAVSGVLPLGFRAGAHLEGHPAWRPANVHGGRNAICGQGRRQQHGGDGKQRRQHEAMARDQDGRACERLEVGANSPWVLMRYAVCCRREALAGCFCAICGRDRPCYNLCSVRCDAPGCLSAAAGKAGPGVKVDQEGAAVGGDYRVAAVYLKPYSLRRPPCDRTQVGQPVGPIPVSRRCRTPRSSRCVCRRT